MKRRILTLIFMLLVFGWGVLSVYADGLKKNEKQGSLLIGNYSYYEIFHVYYINDQGDYSELPYTQSGNIIPSWDAVEVFLPTGPIQLLAELGNEGDYFAIDQYIEVAEGKSYTWEITEALWADYQSDPSYGYMDYGYMNYGYMDYGYMESGY